MKKPKVKWTFYLLVVLLVTLSCRAENSTIRTNTASKFLNNLDNGVFFKKKDSISNKKVLIFLDIKRLELAKEAIKAKKKVYLKAYKQVINLANEELEKEVDPVTNKKVIPASGNKHDYHTLSPYHWPDPSKKDGLPWIYKDGEFNPVNFGSDTDWERLKKMFSSLNNLNLAYYFSEEEKYLLKAKEIVRVWFIDEATKVNPNVNYGQAIPGKVSGTNFAIIDWSRIGNVVTTIQLLEETPFWSAEENSLMQYWFKDYYKWLKESKFGVVEDTRKNNHATNYDYQLIGLMLYLNKIEEAKEKIASVKSRRINTQIAPDGSQPYELERTKSVNYSVNNLWAFIRIVDLAKRFSNIDLWNYKSTGGSSVKNAINFMVPYVLEETNWQWKQIERSAKKQLFKMALPLLLKTELIVDEQILSIEVKVHNTFTPEEILIYAP